MVYYIKANLLSQKYELNPTEEVREDILKTIRQAMTQFQSEADDMRKDYTRMLMLKMAYCYLGLNLFGKNVKDAVISEDDRKSAKPCLDFIETQDIWKRMESRRKMLYYIAKAEYYRQGQLFDQSKIYAKEAETFDLICDIESSINNFTTNGKTAEEIIEQLLLTKLESEHE